MLNFLRLRNEPGSGPMILNFQEVESLSLTPVQDDTLSEDRDTEQKGWSRILKIETKTGRFEVILMASNPTALKIDKSRGT